MTAAVKIEWIRIALNSVGDTLTNAEALSLIAHLAGKTKKPELRIDRARLAALLAAVDHEERKPQPKGEVS